MAQGQAKDYSTFSGDSATFKGLISGGKTLQGKSGKAINGYGKYTDTAGDIVSAFNPALGKIVKMGGDYQKELLTRVFGGDSNTLAQQNIMNEQNKAIQSNTQGIMGAIGNSFYGRNIGSNTGQNAMGITNQVQTFKYGGNMGGVLRRKLTKYEMGGVMNGGQAIPLSQDASLMQGNTHQQGGIEVANQQGMPMAEVEHKEVVSKIDVGNGEKQEFVFTASLPNPKTGNLFSDDATMLEMKKGKFQKALEQKGREKDSKIVNSIKQVDNSIRDLASQQEEVKMQIQAQQQAMMQQQAQTQGQQPSVGGEALMPQEQGQMKYGGLMKYAMGGGMNTQLEYDKDCPDCPPKIIPKPLWNESQGTLISPKVKQITSNQSANIQAQPSPQQSASITSVPDNNIMQQWVNKGYYTGDEIQNNGKAIWDYHYNKGEPSKMPKYVNNVEQITYDDMPPIPQKGGLGSMSPSTPPTLNLPFVPVNGNTPSPTDGSTGTNTQYNFKGGQQGINPIPSMLANMYFNNQQKGYNIGLEASPLVYQPNMDAQLQAVQNNRNLSGKLLSNRATSLGSLASNLARTGTETFNQDSQIMSALNNEAGGRASNRESLAQGVKQRNVDRVNTFNRDDAAFNNAKIQSNSNSVQNAFNQWNTNKRDKMAYDKDAKQAMIGLMGMGYSEKEAAELAGKMYGGGSMTTSNAKKGIGETLGGLYEQGKGMLKGLGNKSDNVPPSTENDDKGTTTTTNQPKIDRQYKEMANPEGKAKRGSGDMFAEAEKMYKKLKNTKSKSQVGKLSPFGIKLK